MKICYCDESGTGNEKIAVMVGIVVDSQRMHVTKENWLGLLKVLSRVIGVQPRELHTRDFYAGNGVWHGMTGPKRSLVIDSVFKWIADRKHHIVYTSVNKDSYFKYLKAGQIYPELNTPWRFMGFHLLLSIQKYFQRYEKTKGNTIIVFDNEEKERMRFTDLIANPPSWSDTYYLKGKKQNRLDQIVDVPYFGDSREVSLIQVADFIAFFLRRYAEIKDGYTDPRYPDEMVKVDGWMNILREHCISPTAIYPSTGRCECAETFYVHASNSIKNLHKT